jgi:hypothetical protein
MYLRSITRLMAVAGTVLLAGAASPAFGQADVTVAITGPTGVNVGATNDYTVVISNGAAAAGATNVTLTMTLPAALTDPSFAGCVVSSPATPNVCTIATLAAGASATVTVSAMYEVPDPYPTTCPTTETIGAVTASVEAENDTTAATATVATTPINPFADVTVALTPPVTDINSGQTVTIHGVVTNNGPCVADAVAAEFVYPTALGFNSATEGTPAFCAAPVTIDEAFADFGCDMGDLVAGESRTFDATFTLAQLPSDLLRGNYPLAASVAATDMYDPLPDNNAGRADNRYDEDVSGCSTGGAGTLVGLLSLLALRFGRRRS